MHSAGPSDILKLIRFPVTLAVTFTAFAAMFLQQGEFSHAMWWPLAGIFLLAGGASAFNQYQEWPWDEKMERTRRRPIPSRRISPAEGVRIAMIGIAGGLLVLAYNANWVCLVLGVLNLVWYNGLYTWLKRKTAFAVVPGALTGAIPVMMGWSALSGEVNSPVMFFLAFFIFLWQMPHFWMIMLKYGDDYRAAGFPVINDLLTNRQVKHVIMAWIIASSALSVMLVYFGMTRNPVTGIIISLFSIILPLLIFHQFYLAGKISFRLISMAGNLYVMAILILLMADGILTGQ